MNYGPPPGWKRPAIPLSVKVTVLERQLCKLLGCEKLEYDHRPPLSERDWASYCHDTMPGCNNPDFIEAIPVAKHRERTFGRGGEKRVTTLGSDAHTRAKTKRLSNRWITSETLATMLADWTKKRSRPLPGGKGSKFKKKLSGKVVPRKP